MSPWSTLQTDQTLPSIGTWGFIDHINEVLMYSKWSGNFNVSTAGWAARTSPPQLCCHGRHPWADDAVSDSGFFLFCIGLSVESQPGSKSAEGKGLLLVWNTSLIITSVIADAMPWAHIWASHSKGLALPLQYQPREGSTGYPGTLKALWELCGTAEEQQFVEDGRSPSCVSTLSHMAPVHPCFPLLNPSSVMGSPMQGCVCTQLEWLSFSLLTFQSIDTMVLLLRGHSQAPVR